MQKKSLTIRASDDVHFFCLSSSYAEQLSLAMNMHGLTKKQMLLRSITVLGIVSYTSDCSMKNTVQQYSTPDSDNGRIAIIHESKLFVECATRAIEIYMSDEHERFEKIIGIHACDPDEAAQQLVDGKASSAIMTLHTAPIVESVRAKMGECWLGMFMNVPASEEEMDMVSRMRVQALISNEGTLAHMVDAIRGLIKREEHCPQSLMSMMFKRLQELRRESFTNEIPRSANITQREMEVLQLLVDRKTNEDIAHTLAISIYTVKNHVHNILEKLNVTNRHAAADVARRLGFKRRTS